MSTNFVKNQSYLEQGLVPKRKKFKQSKSVYTLQALNFSCTEPWYIFKIFIISRGFVESIERNFSYAVRYKIILTKYRVFVISEMLKNIFLLHP